MYTSIEGSGVRKRNDSNDKSVADGLICRIRDGSIEARDEPRNHTINILIKNFVAVCLTNNLPG